MSVNFPPCPQSLKQIQHYLKTAQEHDGRDIVVSYWCRLYSLQVALKLTTKLPEENALLMAIMSWLEKTKKENIDNDAISNELSALAYLENYALKLFLYADKQDREQNFGKNVVKAFYTSGMIYDVLQTFDELNEDATQNRKYAKWKAAYIHNCLKNGETPIPGPITTDEHGNPIENKEQGETNNEYPEPNISQTVSNTEDDKTIGRSYLAAEDVLKNPEKLPNPPVDEEKNPGGFIAFNPSEQTADSVYIPPSIDIQLTPEQLIKAKKFCKYADSALNYDDVKAAIDNLQKALRLLQTGQE